MTLAVLIEVATEAEPDSERTALRRELYKAISAGDAVLLLDGLDECLEQSGTVSDGLATIISRLPADAGFILTTRDNAVRAAAKLNLPEAQLSEPVQMDSVISRILHHAALFRGVPESEREAWVGERKHQLKSISRDHRDLWQIPLLATLLTLLIARRDGGSLPRSRAQLLQQAVRDTVGQWELARVGDTAVDQESWREQRLDGYGEIAHALRISPGGLSKTSAQERVAAMLADADGWRLPRREAEVRSIEICRFWDDRVGVFVASPPADNIRPRSRVFAEIGDAMWVIRQPPQVQGKGVWGETSENLGRTGKVVRGFPPPPAGRLPALLC